MKTIGKSTFLAAGAMALVVSVLAAGCSGKSSSGDSAAGIFEKGKTYYVQTIKGEQTVTVQQVGPGSWLKVTVAGSDGEQWLNAQHIITAQSPPPAPTTQVAESPFLAPATAPAAAPPVFIHSRAGDVPVEGDVPADGLKECAPVLDLYVVRHGDTWFTANGDGDQKRITEHHQVQVVVQGSELSEVDRLNGVEWRGTLGITATASREYNDNQWSEWGPFFGDLRLAISLEKRNGKWSAMLNKAGAQPETPACAGLERAERGQVMPNWVAPLPAP